MNKKKMENEIDCLDQMLSDWKKIEMKVAFEFKTSWKEREREMEVIFGSKSCSKFDICRKRFQILTKFALTAFFQEHAGQFASHIHL